MAIDRRVSALQALPRLPGAGETHSPVTLEAGRHIVLRARGKDEPAMEVVLERSKWDGPAARLSFGRQFLSRALRLGFHEVVFSGSNRPLLCKDGRRIYCWMPLDESSVVPPAEKPAVLAADCAEQITPIHHEPERREVVMLPNNGTSHSSNGVAPTPESIDPLTEAEALRLRLQEALASASRIIAFLRQQRKQSRAVHAAVASLRRLQDLNR